MKKLLEIQSELKCPKGSLNKFGNYKYRSAEQILESVKPLLAKHGAILILSDSIEQVGNKLFLKATATLKCEGGIAEVLGWAELSEHKGMSGEQCTGTASSYARKYALNHFDTWGQVVRDFVNQLNRDLLAFATFEFSSVHFCFSSNSRSAED